MHWDIVINGWNIQAYKKTINIVYDANNNLISEIEQTWNGNAWDNFRQYTYIYDANNNRISNLIQTGTVAVG